ncbi:MAG: hydrogenase maturation protease [Armatimonadota bacterium]
MKTLILGLGNELLSDDGVGLFAARALSKEMSGRADVVESSLAGLALLEHFLDYQRAIIIDAVMTERHPAGTIYELTPADLDTIVAPSPHYAGLPEMLRLSEQLSLDFPHDIKIFAMEIADPFTVGGPLSAQVQQAMPGLLQKVREQVDMWEREVAVHA